MKINNLTKGNKNQKKAGNEVKTFPVPFSLRGNNITTTNTSSRLSKKEIIKQAFYFHSKGNISEAAKYYQLFIDQGFEDYRIFSNYGEILTHFGKLKEAEFASRKAIKLKPDFAEAHYNLGSILSDLGKLKEAEFASRKAIELKPNFAEAHYNLGSILSDLGKLKEAEFASRKAIELKPDYAKAHLNLGNVLKNLGNFEEAIVCQRTAIELKPDFALAYSNLGSILQKLDKLKEAELSCRKAIELEPSLAEAHYNLGFILSDFGKLEEAELSARKAIELQPDLVEAHKNLSFILLKRKKFQEGFNEYEWRLKVNDRKNLTGDISRKGKPEWTPNDKGKVLLWAEQGIGDEILFASLIPELVEQVDQLIVQVDDRLIPLFQRSFNKRIRYINKNQSINKERYDSQISMGSLLKFLRKSKEDFKIGNKKYLKVNHKKRSFFRETLKDLAHEKIIGISWKSTSKLEKGINLSLERFLLGIYSPKIKFLCLQYGNVEKEINQIKEKHRIKIEVINEVDLFNDIDGLASLIASCDEVVSIDNLTLHLSGAIGIKTNILLSYKSHWYHGIDDKKSYWFPTVNFFRQKEPNGWDLPLKELRDEIKIN